ncbi:hypothetical protein A2397_04960 [Candidatus Amesbacteria bacterium RIFOXYB1_FULL_44_23]|uniref:Uncharacterized protein n=1 Tax=Candidatus Amesbacteria bacterium RIFOXYB1_FULL_44_23 TaxID=1797263 RepID=A0A1F4ZT83_9BACT|nr:MAG: hypothetical protein A2397_04960 [Candidatus Amesbacteria bacterium RIFOXYB1_FULL_44_23]
MNSSTSNKENKQKIKDLMDRLDCLTMIKIDMSIHEAQEVLDDFARIQIFLNESTCYPSPYKPESLLPRKKDKIENAFAIAMRYENDPERKNTLYLNYCNLIDSFRPDNEAERLNTNMLQNLTASGNLVR